MRSDKRIEKERKNREHFLNGELGLDVYDLRKRLAEKELTYVNINSFEEIEEAPDA